MQNESFATLPDMMLHSAERFGESPAIVDGNIILSFAELHEEVRKAAAAFSRAGLVQGERVAIWAPNSAYWIIACLGAQAAGAAVVPLNTRLKATEAAYILNRSRCAMLMTHGVFLGIDHATLLHGQSLPHLRATIRFDDDWQSFTAVGRDMDAARDASAAVQPSDISDIMFTSGTTGHPKGVMTTHEQTIRVFQAWAARVGLRHGDRYLVVNPFFHTFGYKAGWLACLLTGATIYPVAQFNAGEVAAIIERERITVMPGPPTVFIALLQDAVLRANQWRALASLRVAVTGAASISPDLINGMRQDLGIDEVLTGYGLTESSGVVTMSDRTDNAELVAQSCGRAIPGVELRIAGATKIGDTGEVLVRGYNVMQGYFDDTDGTREAIDPDGWLHTGDIGCLDSRGYLRITDRLKDMYISGGFNCYPAEIERILMGHPEIAQAAVIGMPDARLGEVGEAFIVPRTGATLQPENVLQWARDAMANYKLPRLVHIVAALPTNASGKILKSQLRGAAATPAL